MMRPSALLRAVPERDRRALVHGGAIVGLMLLWSKGVPAWHQWETQVRASAAERVREAIRADRLVERLPGLRDSLRARSGRLVATAPLILRGDTPAEATAALTSLIEDAASDAGVELAAVQPQVPEDLTQASSHAVARQSRHAFIPVVVHAELTGDVVALTQFLADLEHGPTVFSLRELVVSQSEPAAPSTRMETLHAGITLAGLARAAAGAQPVGSQASESPSTLAGQSAAQ